MRIIGGRLKGIQFYAPTNLPVRPTTDMAKEALFNILYNNYDFNECEILDLFSGTGSVSFEFASRGAKKITAIDKHPGCIAWIKSIITKHELNEIEPAKADVLKFLAQDTHQYQIIFADPPYDLPSIPQIPELVFKNNLLAPNGLLVVEHATYTKLNQQPGYTHTRKYGNSSFSFFENQQ